MFPQNQTDDVGFDENRQIHLNVSLFLLDSFNIENDGPSYVSLLFLLTQFFNFDTDLTLNHQSFTLTV